MILKRSLWHAGVKLAELIYHYMQFWGQTYFVYSYFNHYWDVSNIVLLIFKSFLLWRDNLLFSQLSVFSAVSTGVGAEWIQLPRI